MMQVLLIDDERAIRRALREILEFEGCVVEEAENGAQALEMLKVHTYELIFSDIKMPQMDGLELHDQILALAKPLAIKVAKEIQSSPENLSEEDYNGEAWAMWGSGLGFIGSIIGFI